MSAAEQPDIDGLSEFSRHSDRQLSPFFVGREAVIEDIEWTCRAAFRSWRTGRAAGVKGTTRLLQGAPGAGKTAILEFLGEKWRNEAGAPIPVWLDSLDLASWPALVRAMRDKIPSAALMKFIEFVRERMNLRVGAPGLEMQLSGDGGGKSSRAALNENALTRPVCLMVDEIRTIRTATVRADILDVLHQGVHGQPMVVVLAGLAHSRQRLREAGLSRFADGAVHTLPALGEDETRRAVVMFLDRFRVRGRRADGEVWAGRIAGDSQGWPQHLHNALRALAQELADRGGDLSAADPDAVLALSRRRRERYYSARLTEECHESISLLAEILRRMDPRGTQRGDLVDLIKLSQQGRAGTRWELPSGMDAPTYVRHLLGAGVLQDDHGILICPIPSFRTFIVDLAGPEGGHPA